MIHEMTHESLADLVSGVLENAAFVFVEETQEAEWPYDEIICASLSIQHDDQVTLSLCVPVEFGPSLAANLLGLDAADSEEAQASANDAVGELTNMVAGSLAVEIFGRDVVCKLGTPQVHRETAAQHQAHFQLASCRVAFTTDDGYRIDAGVVLPASGSAE